MGCYGELFGRPRFQVVLKEDAIALVLVVRGAPCGASWRAGDRVAGLPTEVAAVRFGLETQFFCAADPAGWDPLSGKSPVHFAGEVHKKALEQAIAIARS